MLHLQSVSGRATDKIRQRRLRTTVGTTWGEDPPSGHNLCEAYLTQQRDLDTLYVTIQAVEFGYMRFLCRLRQKWVEGSNRGYISIFIAKAFSAVYMAQDYYYYCSLETEFRKSQQLQKIYLPRDHAFNRTINTGRTELCPISETKSSYNG